MPITAARLSSKENSASRAWLRALEMTAKIDAAPSRIFPRVIEELGCYDPRKLTGLALAGSKATMRLDMSILRMFLASLCSSLQASPIGSIISRNKTRD